MRIESSVTSLSWIPSEAIRGLTSLPFDMGVAHYDEPPPDRIADLEALRNADRFRFANQLRAWVEVEDGRITVFDHAGQGLIGSTTMRLGGRVATFAAVAFPDRRQAELLDDGSVRFVQTAGGRTGVPAPRRVSRPPFIQVTAPLAWTTLALTIRADGSTTHQLIGASPFPRHWVYDSDGMLAQKSGLVDFRDWSRNAFGKHTPWGDEDTPALVAEVESALERELSTHIMRGGTKPKIRELRKGQVLVTQGEPGTTMFLVLDGFLTVEVDGRPVGDLGPGAVLGERAVIEGGVRTATARAVTACRVASISGSDIEPALLAQLAEGHRREDAAS